MFIINSMIKIIVKILSLLVIIALIVIIIILIMTYNTLEMSNKYDKNEMITTIKSEIDDLNDLNKDLLSKYGDKKGFNIGNKSMNNCVEYETSLKNKLFTDLNIKEINYIGQYSIMHYTIDTKLSTTYSFYYTKDDKKNLYSYENEKDLINDDCYILEYNNWAIMIYKKSRGRSWYHSIYTERITDNWYYLEDYWYSFEAMKYIKNDLKKIGKYDEVIALIGD